MVLNLFNGNCITTLMVAVGTEEGMDSGDTKKIKLMGTS